MVGLARQCHGREACRRLGRNLGAGGEEWMRMRRVPWCKCS